MPLRAQTRLATSSVRTPARVKRPAAPCESWLPRRPAAYTPIDPDDASVATMPAMQRRPARRRLFKCSFVRKSPTGIEIKKDDVIASRHKQYDIQLHRRPSP